MTIDTRTNTAPVHVCAPKFSVTVMLSALVVSAVAMICAGAWIGVAVSEGMGRSELGWAAAGYPATAFTVEPGPVTPSPGGDGLGAPRQVTVRWVAPDGTQRRGDVLLPAPVQASMPVPVIVDGDGIPHPNSAGSVRTVGFVAGATGAFLGWVGMWVAGTLIRELVIRRNGRRRTERSRS
jgi:hypothetical protein